MNNIFTHGAGLYLSILLLVREVIHILEIHLLLINVCSLLIDNNANREINNITI